MRWCEDLRIWGLADLRMWWLADVRMREFEDVRMWGFEDVRISRFEDLRISRCEDVRIWGCEDVRMWGLADVVMWGLWRKDILKLFKVPFHNKTSDNFNISLLRKQKKQIIEGIKIQRLLWHFSDFGFNTFKDLVRSGSSEGLRRSPDRT